jgi:hypothetical protein
MRRLLYAALLFVGPLLAGPAASGAACPAPADGTARLSFTAEQLARPHYTDVIAGGRLDLAACPAVAGAGRVTGAPDFTVEIRDAAPRGLELRAEGGCDTVLLVTADGRDWRFDDDGAGGEDPRIRIADAGSGRYHVWIGTYGPGSCRARLIVTAVR